MISDLLADSPKRGSKVRNVVDGPRTPEARQTRPDSFPESVLRGQSLNNDRNRNPLARVRVFVTVVFAGDYFLVGSSCGLMKLNCSGDIP